MSSGALRKPEEFVSQFRFNRIIYPCWDMDPARRPTMKAICGLIEDYRNGSGSKPIGYYDTLDGSYGVDSRAYDNSGELYYDAK